MKLRLIRLDTVFYTKVINTGEINESNCEISKITCWESEGIYLNKDSYKNYVNIQFNKRTKGKTHPVTNIYFYGT